MQGLVALGGAEPAAVRGPARVGTEPELDDDRLVELALEGSNAGLHRESAGRYAIEFTFEGRRQEVSVLFGSTDHEGSEVVIVYANCGEASPEHYEKALRLNLKMPYGAIALRDTGGKPCFVMFNTILRQGLSPVELRKSILTVAERSARAGRQLRK
jgi:hypothetical protein